MQDNRTGLYYFFRNRKLFLISILLGGILGCGITFFIPKKYLSTAIIYPANSHTREDLIFNPQFGYEVETEQLMQLLESKTMRDRTIREFKLYDYYKMDTTQPAWESLLAVKYINDVHFFRSKYLSVVINVTTESPELSAKIANFQVSEVNTYRENIFEANRQMEYNHVKNEYEQCKKELDKIKDSIYVIKGGNRQLLYNFIEKLDNENAAPEEFVDDPKLEGLIEQYIYELHRYKSLWETYASMKQKISEPLPSVYSIDEAMPSYKKVSPSFFLNTVLGALVLFLLVLTLHLLIHKWRSLKQELSK